MTCQGERTESESLRSPGGNEKPGTSVGRDEASGKGLCGHPPNVHSLPPLLDNGHPVQKAETPHSRGEPARHATPVAQSTWFRVTQRAQSSGHCQEFRDTHTHSRAPLCVLGTNVKPATTVAISPLGRKLGLG